MSYKTWRNIEFSLNRSSINRAIREIQACKKQLAEAMNALVRELAEQGAQVARMQVASFDAVDSGELEHSIYGYYDPESRIGYVIAGAAHAFYVEYGTGPVGAENPHPEPERAGWQYAIGDHIFTTKTGKVGWVYNAGSNGVFGFAELSGGKGWAFTEGQPARPFMYNTLVWLEEAAEALGRKILS